MRSNYGSFVLVFVCVMGILLLYGLSVIWKGARYRNPILVSLIGGICVFGLFAAHNRAWNPTGRPIIANSARFGAVDVAIVQVHGGLGIYDTSLFVGLTNNWVWYYLDHDGGYWAHAELRINERNGEIQVLRSSTPRAVFQLHQALLRNLKSGRRYEKPIGSLVGDIIKNWSTRTYDETTARDITRKLQTKWWELGVTSRHHTTDQGEKWGRGSGD